jgi:hypothetical protein
LICARQVFGSGLPLIESVTVAVGALFTGTHADTAQLIAEL